MEDATSGSSEPLQTPHFSGSYGCYEASEGRLPRHKVSLTPLDGFFSLVKASLGPGALSLPYVFGRVGWVFGFPILLAVVVGGAYMMMIVTKCKQALARPGIDNVGDLAQVTLGRNARLAADFFVFAIQSGSGCIFINFVAGDLMQNLGVLSRWKMTILLVPFFAVLALARFASQLSYFNSLGVMAMAIACATSIVCGMQQLLDERGWEVIADRALPLRPFTDSVILCSSTFFAFEGFGTLLPIEKEMDPVHFPSVLILAASTLGLLYVAVGSTCGVAFRGELQSGSILAFLASRPGSSSLVESVSWLVTAAVFLTYPLQTLPAMQLFEKYLGRAGTEHVRAAWVVPLWVWDRLVLLICQAIVALSVSNVALLVALFGAVGQTGLGMVASLSHLELMHSGSLPMNHGLVLADVLLFCLCVVIMIFGTYFAADDIIAAWWL